MTVQCIGILANLLLTAATFASPSDTFPVIVRGATDLSFVPRAADRVDAARDLPSRYDVVVIGGGLSGLSASLYLSDRGKRVLLLEKEPVLGGAAFGGIDTHGVAFNRGAAYWTAPSAEMTPLMKRIGLGDLKSREIPEPVDSYLWNGKLYDSVWEPKTLARLPVSFSVFKAELQKAEADHHIAIQPFETSTELALDELDAETWIRQMPAKLAARTDASSRAITKRYNRAKAPDAGMSAVVEFLDLYCRSAFGASCRNISAAAFANFYIAELEPRFTSPIGTGEIARKLIELLETRKSIVEIRMQAKAQRIELNGAGSPVRIHFTDPQGAWIGTGTHAIFAAQLKFLPKLLPRLAELDAPKASAIQRVEYAHSEVHVVRTKGHPYRAAYDTWVRPRDASPFDFTDVILGRWMDPTIQGYAGMRDFKKNPKDEHGIFTLYLPFFHPVETVANSQKSRTEHAEAMARRSVSRLLEILNPVLKKGQKISVESVETNLWPFSFHIVRPRYFREIAPHLRRPVGNLFFAHTNIGTPAVEEALHRGHCAAVNVLKRLSKSYAPESWSRCIIE